MIQLLKHIVLNGKKSMDALLRGYQGGWGMTPFLVSAQRHVTYVLTRGPDTTKATENKLALP